MMSEPRDQGEPVVIGEAGKRFGLSVSTLRYWEERGLIHATERRGGRRYYGPDQLHRIGLIQMWRETGLMSVDEIAVALGGEGDWREAVQGRVRAIQEQIERLRVGQAHLEHLLTCPRDAPALECEYLRKAVAERMRGNPVTPEDLRHDGDGDAEPHRGHRASAQNGRRTSASPAQQSTTR